MNTLNSLAKILAQNNGRPDVLYGAAELFIPETRAPLDGSRHTG
jgi:hypothetical protein